MYDIYGGALHLTHMLYSGRNKKKADYMFAKNCNIERVYLKYSPDDCVLLP